MSYLMGPIALAMAQPASGLPPGESATIQELVVVAPGRSQEDDLSRGVDANAIAGAGKPDLLQALGRTVASLSLQDAQNNPFQPNLVYRGFTASPLQGQAQGLAVYVDGGRFNQPFGDTVQFDLIPEAAVRQATLFDSNPVYGLNALGGALVLETKTGRSSPGARASIGAGRFGESELTAEAGWRSGEASAYAALQRTRDGGWRRFSPSRLLNGFLDAGWDGTRGGVHVKLIAADNDLTGNGSVPVELFAADRRAVFTHPDNTRNRYGRASVHPWIDLGDHSRVEASAYRLRFRQRTLNGDGADVEGCDEVEGLLCLETADDEESLLLDGAGSVIADTLGGEGYGLINRSHTRTSAAGLLAQLVDERPFGSGRNRLVAGLSVDRSRTRFASSSELGALTDDRGVEGLGPIVTQPDGSIAPVELVARTRYLGLFLSNRLPLGSGLAAEVDVRWNDAKVVLDDRIGTALDGSHRFRRLNFGAELDWQATPSILLELGVSEANRAPTPAELACADEAAPCSLTNFFVGDPPLKQVVTRTFSAALKGRAGTIEWQLAAYRSTNRDDIQFTASSIRGRAFFRNIGSTRRQGIEATAIYRRGSLSTRIGYALTDATFRSPLILNAPENPQAEDDGRIAVRRGDQLPGIPRHRVILAADWERPGWVLGGDVQLASGQIFHGDEGNDNPRTAGYSLVNLRGSIRLARRVHLFGEIRNLFDRRFATFGTYSATGEIDLAEAPGASDPRSIGPGAPRRWLIGLRYSRGR